MSVWSFSSSSCFTQRSVQALSRAESARMAFTAWAVGLRIPSSLRMSAYFTQLRTCLVQSNSVNKRL